MSFWYSQRMRAGFAAFAVAMAGLAAWVWLRYSASIVAVTVAAIAIVCVGVMLYVWWLARRALRPLDDARRSGLRRTS